MKGFRESGLMNDGSSGWSSICAMRTSEHIYIYIYIYILL